MQEKLKKFLLNSIIIFIICFLFLCIFQIYQDYKYYSVYSKEDLAQFFFETHEFDTNLNYSEKLNSSKRGIINNEKNLNM